MSLQFDHPKMSVQVKQKSNVMNISSTIVLGMVENLHHAVTINPENAPQIALQFVRRIASCDLKDVFGARGGLAPWQKRKVDRYLGGNLEQNICLNNLASEVRLSVSHFCRAFKKTFGETPHAYVVRLRLELAQELMLSTNEPLSRIALRCGMADQAHLSKQFRRTFHDTPNAWRRRNLTEAQAETKNQLPKTRTRDEA
jgi:AraC family transcriptional regulator